MNVIDFPAHRIAQNRAAAMEPIDEIIAAVTARRVMLVGQAEKICLDIETCGQLLVRLANSKAGKPA